ncbi:MAG TPA: hypothetical protein VEC56_10665 [Candidatus Krumholzibacteria bacterium]|nr:hypothetical protein [Candidatus Krumholzibacteria bacterium]
MNRTRRITSGLLIVTLFASTVTMPFATAVAGTPGDDLKQIEYKYYFRGKYQQAIESLQTYLARVDLPEPEAMRAREVLAASYVLGGAPAMGKQMFSEMIAKKPSYPGPDPNVFKLEVMDAYAQARSEYAALALKNAPSSAGKNASDRDRGAAALPSDALAEAGKPIYKKWWFYAGAAALIAAVGVAAGGGGDDGTPPPAETGGVTVGVIVH